MLDSFAFGAILDDPHARHAAFVHFPIALSVIAVPAVIAHACTGFRHRVLALVTCGLLLAAAGGAGLAAGAGEEAQERIHAAASPPLDAAEDQAMERHEALGEGAWMWPTGAALLVAGTLLPRPRIRVGAGGLAVAACIAVAGWALLAGKSGGELVYEHGLGVPVRAVE